MQAEQVIKKIKADAQNEAENILKQAKKKLEAEKPTLDEELKRYEIQTQQIAKKAQQDEKTHILAAARMRIAKQNLAEKRAILNEVFERAIRKIRDLDDDRYKTLIEKRMLEAVETGDEEVLLDNSEKRIDMDFLKEINRKLAPGFKGNLRLAPSGMNLGGGGFILKRGKIKTNVSLTVLIEQARKDLEIQLAKELFTE